MGETVREKEFKELDKLADACDVAVTKILSSELLAEGTAQLQEVVAKLPENYSVNFDQVKIDRVVLRQFGHHFLKLRRPLGQQLGRQYLGDRHVAGIRQLVQFFKFLFPHRFPHENALVRLLD